MRMIFSVGFCINSSAKDGRTARVDGYFDSVSEGIQGQGGSRILESGGRGQVQGAKAARGSWGGG